ncbi:MAG: thiazole synthase [Pseudomonadota bacterium]
MSDKMKDNLIIAGRSFASRLLVGTGKYADMAQTKAVIEASGAEIVTVALRRVDLSQKGEGSLIEAISPKEYTYLPNSAGCYTAEEAVRTLHLARELGGWNLVKLEVIGDKQTLYPDTQETLKAAEILVKDGFLVMAYTNDDLIMARRLEDAGCSAVMPLAAPIGSGLGILNPRAIHMIACKLKVPVLVDAGIGTASDACIAMELGCAGVLLNTALSSAKEPILMAKAMKQAVEAGRKAFLAGRMEQREGGSPSSPAEGMLSSPLAQG